MSQTLAEFGRGFAFYGRQYHLDVEGDDFYIDLLLVHVPTNRFVVVELKSGKFKSEHLGSSTSTWRPSTIWSSSPGWLPL
jgi:predicted nuclease of restriction endonuclease-like (RecB) superfamily